MTLLSGCAISNQAQWDLEGKQMDPYYKPTAPPDGRPQWSFFGYPER